MGSGTHLGGPLPPLVVDEVGFIPFDPEAASLSVALIRSCRGPRSLIVTPNSTFSAWAEIVGDPVAVAALVDRLAPRRGPRRPGRARGIPFTTQPPRGAGGGGE